MNRILVIDDDGATLDVIKLLFEMENYIVLGLDNCATLGSCLDTFKPSVVLMDVIMGTIDGRDVCKELKTSKHKHIPLMLMSVVSGFHIDPVKPLHSDDYIEKPFDLDVMLSKVERLIHKSKA